MAALEGAIRAGRAETVERSAHRLKGAVGNFQAQTSYDLALELEKAGRDGALDAAARLYPALQAEVGRLVEALREMKEDG